MRAHKFGEKRMSRQGVFSKLSEVNVGVMLNTPGEEDRHQSQPGLEAGWAEERAEGPVVPFREFINRS